MKRAFTALAVVVAVGLLADDGHACTLVPQLLEPDPWGVVGAADAAFVGTVVDERRARAQPSEPVILTFEVERWLKGGASPRVQVHTSGSSASCGLGLAVGQRVGLVATSSQGRLSAGLGDQYDPAFLVRGAAPLPRPTGSGPGRLLAGGAFGDSRLALLDGKARVLRYGKGQGVVAAVSVCPGGRDVLELVNRRGTAFLGVRDLPTLRLVRETRLAGNASGVTVVCVAPAGADALATISVFVPANNSSGMQLVRVTAVGTRVLERAERLEFAVRGARAAVSFHTGELVLRDLKAATRRPLLRTRILAGMSFSPDGRYLAGSTDRLTIVDLERRSSDSRAGITGTTDWAGNDRILVGSGISIFGNDGRIELVDRTLRPLRPPTPWKSAVTTLDGGRAFGIRPPGTVVSMSATGKIAALAPIFSTGVGTLAVLPSS